MNFSQVWGDAICWLRGWLPWPSRAKQKAVGGMSIDIPDRGLAIVKPKLERASLDDGRSGADFYFRDAILDELDRYFFYVRRMRQGDREAYDLYSKVGANVLPADSVWWNVGIAADLEPWWAKNNRPSFGAVAFSSFKLTEEIERKDISLLPKFLYFRKYTLPPKDIQPASGGDIYVVTVYWDQDHDGKMKYGVPTEFPVLVRPDGQVRVLKMLRNAPVRVRGRKGTFLVPHRTWGHSGFFKDWAAENGRDLEDHLRSVFVCAANAFSASQLSGVQVRVRRGKNTALFSVDVVRTPYFFKDRDITLGASGSRKKIFHIVRTHKRVRADGKESFVKTHFKGERSFRWNGYDVEITVPCRDHFSLAEFDVGAVDAGHIDAANDAVGPAVLASYLEAARAKDIRSRKVAV